MEKLTNTDAELKKSNAYKQSVHIAVWEGTTVMLFHLVLYDIS